ncbi:cobalamin-binding protein [Rubrolithibacter danxiaensis]|uniref:cobalamin-binding protein n=1 Tax=Rubrolithibacter danxiaensis TaxID=3390805 RepID=UPI003BF77FD4
MSSKKIVSLLPAATEIVCALGLEEQLIGRSHECDFPENICLLPVCSTAKFTPGSDSVAIDRQVKEILTEALSIYDIDIELIRQLQPDIIITQSQCEVCAVSLDDVSRKLEGLLEKDVEIISLEPHVLNDLFKDIRMIAKSLNVTEKAEQLIEGLQERLDLIKHKLKFIEQKPRVACVEWLSPLMIAGNWTPELVETAGGIPVLAEKGKHSFYIDIASIQQEDPDILILIPCGFSISRTLQEINLLLEIHGWNELKAVQNNQVYVADGNQYFNRSGPRLVDSAEILAEIINPKQFVFGYEGQGWVKFGTS